MAGDVPPHGLDYRLADRKSQSIAHGDHFGGALPLPEPVEYHLAVLCGSTSACIGYGKPGLVARFFSPDGYAPRLCEFDGVVNQVFQYLSEAGAVGFHDIGQRGCCCFHYKGDPLLLADMGIESGERLI
jgi:hypothetical protein